MTNIEELKRLALAATEYAGYSVDSAGNVWSSIPWRGSSRRMLTPSPNSHGYLTVKVKIEGGMKKAFVHKMVCIAFHGQRPSPEHEVRHLDGNKLNNRSSNLAWGTRSDNAIDRKRHGTCAAAENGRKSACKSSASFKRKADAGLVNFARGSKQGTSKIVESDVLEIRRLRSTNTCQQIAGMYGLDQSTVARIIRRVTWTHI